MSKDLKQTFWCPKKKEDVTHYVADYFVCQQVKAEHQRPAVELQPLLFPQWK